MYVRNYCYKKRRGETCFKSDKKMVLEKKETFIQREWCALRMVVVMMVWFPDLFNTPLPQCVCMLYHNMFSALAA